MKKGFFMTLCAALMLCFAACDKDEEGNTNNSNTPNNDTPSGQVDPALLPGTWLVDTMTINGQTIPRRTSCSSSTPTAADC